MRVRQAPPSESARRAGRDWRLRRRLAPHNGYMLSPEAGLRADDNLARTLPRMGAFISLDAAADCRRAYRAGNKSGLRFARFALDRARADQARWIEHGGSLPT